MLHVPPPGPFGFRYDNLGTNASATPGGLVTAGASPNTESATPLVLASGANLTADVYFVQMWVSNVSGTGDRSQLLDFGWDTAGGTSYTWHVQNIITGNTAGITLGSPGQYFCFPVRIPAGSQVAVRTQNAQASITTRVCATFFGLPGGRMMLPVATFSETIGTITNSTGTSISPGNAAFSNWASLGTTTNPMWWWQMSYQVSNATVTAEYTYIEIGWGDGTAGGTRTIHKAMHGGTTAENCADFNRTNLSLASYHPVPAGATIYARAACLNAPDTGYNVLAHGFGG